MLKLNNILVPQDFTAPAKQALAQALDLADRVGATVHQVAVDVMYENTYASVVSAFSNIDVEEQLREGLGGREGVEAVVRDLSVSAGIVAYAEKEDIDLIVIGTHGRRGVRRWLLGSVAAEVVRQAPCPVLTVHAPGEEAESVQIPASILVPIDFSRHARTVLAHARELAALYNARLDLLHVIEDILHPAFYHIEVASIYDLHPDIEETSYAELKAFFEGTKGPEVEAAFHVAGGNPAQEIIAFAEAHQSDWVALATHGLRGLDHFLMGSVAEKVVQRVPVPVFTVKSFGKSLLAAPMPERTKLRETA